MKSVMEARGKSGKKCSGRGNCKCKGPEAGVRLGREVQWYLGFRMSPLTNILVYKLRKFYGPIVSLGSKIHTKFAVLGVDFKSLERINPFCMTFHGETAPRFSNVSELERSSETDYVRKSRGTTVFKFLQHCYRD